MASGRVRCQVDRCIFKADNDQERVCKPHSIASSAIVAGVNQRFCHYCGEFHPLLAFDEKKICRRLLADHNHQKPALRLSLGQPGDSSSSLVKKRYDTTELLKESEMRSLCAVTMGAGVGTGAGPSEPGEDSPSSAESSPPRSPPSSPPSSPRDRELCDSIIPGSQTTDFFCPYCYAEIVKCSDQSFQCVRPSCWANFVI